MFRCQLLWVVAMSVLCSAYEVAEQSPVKECKKLDTGKFYGNHTLYAQNSQSRKWLDAFVVPEHKLIFCKLAKNGSSGWLRLLRRMAGFPDWTLNPYFFQDGKIGGLSQLYHFGPERAMDMLLDPTWKKVVILREPLERLLSAFLDKIHGLKDYPKELEIYSKNLFDVPISKFQQMPFGEFVQRLHVAQNAGVLNQHWSIQSLECGLDYWAPVYDLALYMEHDGCGKEQMRQEIFDLLRPTTPDPQGLEAVADSFQGVRAIISDHSTDHSGGWYTPDILEEAYKIYEMDYRLFNIPKPALEDLNA